MVEADTLLTERSVIPTVHGTLNLGRAANRERHDFTRYLWTLIRLIENLQMFSEL